MHIAIIGCGQLSRMLALAGIPQGLTFSFLASPDEDTRCVEGLGSVVRLDADQQPARLYQALGKPDVLTAEKEQLDVGLLQQLAAFCAVHPNPSAFATCQDRLLEKQLLDKLGIANAAYRCVDTLDELTANRALPLLLKSRRDGYDGKHQYRLLDHASVQAFSDQLARENLDLRDFIAEQWIPFDRELSQLSVRNSRGDIQHYPLAENRHNHGILCQSMAPAAGLSQQLTQRAQQDISQAMTALDYVGVMAMECFVLGEQLLVNELAPRVHNSGHWTQSGSATCQFENHLRAICGVPLGSTSNHCVTGMLNLIGTHKPAAQQLLSNAKLHWYNKRVKPGRKLGHINFTGPSNDKVKQQMQTFVYRPELAND